MFIKTSLVFTFFSAVMLIPASGLAQQAEKDLSGVWNPKTFGGFNLAAVPRTLLGQERFEYNNDSRDKTCPYGVCGSGKPELDPRLHCFPPSPYFLMTWNLPFEIIQGPNRVLLMYEYDHWVRRISMNEQHPKDLELTWMGHSIGKWEGDTLVVDTVGMHDDSWLDQAGHERTTNLHIVERFRRVKHDTLEVEITIEDPALYTKPWTRKMTYELRPDYQIEEQVFCDDRYKRGLYFY